jgi:hypothetical protein
MVFFREIQRIYQGILTFAHLSSTLIAQMTSAACMSTTSVLNCCALLRNMRNLGMKFTRPGKRLQFANLNMGNS